MAKKKVSPEAGIPDNETKEERFIRVVTPRVGKAAKAITLIGYCSGSTYAYKKSHIDQICEILRASVDALEKSFSDEGKSANSFEFK